MSNITPAALADLKRRGFKVVFEKFGPIGSGKSTAAQDAARKLRRAGADVFIEDEIVRGSESGARVWSNL